MISEKIEALFIILVLLMIVAAIALFPSNAGAQGFERTCTCKGFPGCWFVAAYAPDGSKGDGQWEWLPLWSTMLWRNLAQLDSGWVCS